VLAWTGAGSQQAMRRLQLAAEEGKGFGVVFGPTRNAALPSPAPLRIQLTAGREKLQLQIIKRRGGGWAPPLSLDVNRSQRNRTERTAAVIPGIHATLTRPSPRLHRLSQGLT